MTSMPHSQIICSVVQSSPNCSWSFLYLLIIQDIKRFWWGIEDLNPDYMLPRHGCDQITIMPRLEKFNNKKLFHKIKRYFLQNISSRRESRGFRQPYAPNKMVNIEISEELHKRLKQERKDFSDTIGGEWNIENTIWEILKIAGNLKDT